MAAGTWGVSTGGQLLPKSPGLVAPWPSLGTRARGQQSRSSAEPPGCSVTPGGGRAPSPSPSPAPQAWGAAGAPPCLFFQPPGIFLARAVCLRLLQWGRRAAVQQEHCLLRPPGILGSVGDPPLWHGVSVPAHTAPCQANAHHWPHPAPTAPLPLSSLNTFPTWQHPRVGAERAPLRGRAVSPTQPGCPRARPAAHGPRGNPGAGACGDAAASPWQRVISRPRAWGRGIWGPRVLLGGVGAPPGGVWVPAALGDPRCGLGKGLWGPHVEQEPPSTLLCPPPRPMLPLGFIAGRTAGQRTDPPPGPQN